MEIGCTRCMGDGGIYPEGSLTKVACPECCNKKLEQENAALRDRLELQDARVDEAINLYNEEMSKKHKLQARWEKLKDLVEDGMAYFAELQMKYPQDRELDGKISALDVVLKELEQDD